MPALNPGNFPPQRDLRYPDFLCIGVQKSATTWLDARLRCHPGLWLPPMKELQYFSELYHDSVKLWAPRQRRMRMTQLLQHYVQTVPRRDWDCAHIASLAHIVAGPIGDAWYGRIFAQAPPDAVCGEVSPDYGQMRPKGIAHALALAPGVRIILSLRDPIERSWSHIRMFAQSRGLTELADLEEVAAHSDLVRRANYPLIIARWRAMLPEERFHVFFLDDVVRAPQSVLEDVCRFLGVECHPDVLREAEAPVHVGDERPMPPSVFDILRRQMKPVYREFEGLYPEVGRRWAARYY